MQNNDTYYSMMGLLNQDKLEAIFHEGAWHSFNDLNDVISKMERCEMDSEDKHSIPDVYGRPFQLKIALENIMDRSSLTGFYAKTKEIVAWRGILTMIALQDFLDFKIKIDIEDYQQEGTAFDEALKYPPASDAFIDVSGWNNRIFHIITLCGDESADYVDIAMFSSMTVVYPVASLKMPKIKSLKWFDYHENKFINPTDKLSKIEKMIVCFWIDYLKEILLDCGENRASIIIKYHLDKYQEELRNGFAEGELENKKCFEVVTCDEEFENILASNVVISKILNSTVKVCMMFSDGCSIKYKELFADQMYYTRKQENPFIGCSFEASHKVDKMMDGYALLPFGKKIQECSREIIDSVIRNFEMQAIYSLEGEVEYIQVKLFLSRLSSDYVDAERRYYPEDLIEESGDTFPILAMWPSVHELEWKKYYIYCEGGKNGTIGLDLADMLTGSNAYVRAVKKFPYAISLKRKTEKAEYDIGMILPEYEEKEIKHKAKVRAIVGIDFGTSGTTVYVNLLDEKIIKPIRFKNVLSKQLTAAEKKDLKIMSQYFVMEKDKQSVVQSSVYRRADNDALLEKVTPILDGIIYQAGENEMIEDSKSIMPNIKWENPSNGEFYKAFIEELCLHIWEELRKSHVTSIEWRYALPMSIINSDTIHQMWQDDIKVFLEESLGIDQSFNQRKYMESEATSLYFLNSEELKQINRNKGYMVVDIGGGSIDIAVWQRQNMKMLMVAQTSIPVAGRFLFTRWIALRMNEIIEQVFAKDSVERIQFKGLNKRIEDENLVNAVIERIINHEDDKIMKAYQQNPAWALRLREQFEFSTALLFFALGSLVGRLQEIGVLKVEKDGNFSIALGGNGSKILDWIKGSDSETKLLEMFIEGIQSRGIDGKLYKPQIIKSKKPKEEVAYGLAQVDWEMIDHSESSNIRESIEVENAIDWNGKFLSKYNKLYYRTISIEENNIRNLITKIDEKIDACDFFMRYMYKQCYKDKI